ncbi:MAG: PEGA domain-containing protein [Verrucomicrobia bacterium]|nr:PEGA domain-containing protein [Verrucomicrobiota bacterium]
MIKLRLPALLQVTVALLLASCALLSSGCASIVKGSTQNIPISSNPTGATVRLDGNNVGQTPTSITAKRKGDHLITIEKAGYQPESIALTRNVGGAVFGNILAGGLIGWGVDAMSGAQYNLSPATINITLQPEKPTGETAQKQDAEVFIQELRKLDQLHESKTITDEEYARTRLGLIEKYTGVPQPKVTPTADAKTSSSPAVTAVDPAKPAANPGKLGLVVKAVGGKILVETVQPDSAAATLKIEPGDEILAYNDAKPDNAGGVLAGVINAPIAHSAKLAWRNKAGVEQTTEAAW